MEFGLKGILAAIAIISTTEVATAQETKAAGSGVLCAYTMVAGALLDAKLCGWEKTAQGEAVTKAVADIEAYMEANFSDPTWVDSYRVNFDNGLAIMKAAGDEGIALYCRGRNPDMPNYFGYMRFMSPDEIDFSELLSRPGQPTYGDCF